MEIDLHAGPGGIPVFVQDLLRQSKYGLPNALRLSQSHSIVTRL